MVEVSSRYQSLLDNANLILEKQAKKQNQDYENLANERAKQKDKGDAEIYEMLNKKAQGYRDKYFNAM